MASFKVKMEDKAAFLNRMEKQNQAIDNHQIKDNKLEGYFEITIDNPEQLKIAKEILKQSPKINTLSEMKKKLTKEEQEFIDELNKSNRHIYVMSKSLIYVSGEVSDIKTVT